MTEQNDVDTIDTFTDNNTTQYRVKISRKLNKYCDYLCINFSSFPGFVVVWRRRWLEACGSTGKKDWAVGVDKTHWVYLCSLLVSLFDMAYWSWNEMYRVTGAAINR